MSDEDEESYYAYIHILPAKTGDKVSKEIVPGSTLSKFNFEEYQMNNNSEKKAVKFKRTATPNKQKCYVLFASRSYEEVENHIEDAKEKNKRFSIPKLNVTMDTTLEDIIDDPNDDDIDNIQNEKQKRKAEKALQNKNKKAFRQKLVDDYANIGGIEGSSKDNPQDLSIDLQKVQSSTPLRIISNENANDSGHLIAALRSYKTQISYLRDEINKNKAESEMWKNMYEELQEKINNRTVPFQNKDDVTLPSYDRIFNRVTLDQNQGTVNEDENLVTLNKGIKCNSVAYQRAYQTKKPAEFIATMLIGILGKEDLAQRCVREQKNNKDQNQLPSTVCEIVGEEFYNFLRVKRFTHSQIDDEMEKINRYFHSSITSTRAKLKRAELMKAIDEEYVNSFETENNEKVEQRSNNKKVETNLITPIQTDKEKIS